MGPRGQAPPLLNESLDKIGGGQNVFRAWFFQGMALGIGDDRWAAFDKTLQVARDHGERVIATLSNDLPECDGSRKDKRYLQWYRSGYRTVVDPGMSSTYRTYVGQVVARYASDPTILAWQMINEANPRSLSAPYCLEDAAAEALRAFADDVGGLIKALDHNHLVSMGNTTSCGLGPAGPAARAAGATSNYQYVHRSEYVDLCEIHDYGFSTTALIDPDKAHISECRDIGKPTFMGEVGISQEEATKAVGGSCSSALACRAQLFDRKLKASFDNSPPVVGWLAWAWCLPADKCKSPAAQDYAIKPGDPTLEVLARYAESP
ncbi:MAG: mannan endo,4-beta-mannosidase [Chloroflexota bacterium]|jgi:endo-1,4-beta-mannosidase|nr:mannan endo,4-beta-mannosidase [Chloroflexota bacterium]